MKKETPHSWKRGAGLADGLKTVAPVAGVPTTGRDPGKAQSKREKRGLRHIDPSVASSSRPSGAGSRHQMGQRRRLGSGQQDRSEAWEQPGHSWPGLFVHAFSSGSLQPAKLVQQLLISEFLEGEFRK